MPSLDEPAGFTSTGMPDELPGYNEWLASTGRLPGQIDDDDDAHAESECRRDRLRREIFRRNIEPFARIVVPRPAA